MNLDVMENHPTHHEALAGRKHPRNERATRSGPTLPPGAR